MRRSGLSLIEVMVAMAICMLGLTLVLQITTLAQRYAQRTADLTEQQILCQNILNEIAYGIRNGESVAADICASNPRFEYSIHSQPYGTWDLRLVEVIVRPADDHETPRGRTGMRDESVAKRRASEFRLTRLIRVQQLGPPPNIDTPPGYVSQEESGALEQ